MREISRISVWKNSSKSEVRIYIGFRGESNQGVYYKTGNSYNPKGTLENLTLEEKSEALRISSMIHGQGVWGQVYENQISEKIVSNENFDLKGLNNDLKKGLHVNVSDYLNM